MGFFRQEYWSGLPFPSPGDLPEPGTEPGFPALQADSLPLAKLKLNSFQLCYYSFSSMFFMFFSLSHPQNVFSCIGKDGLWPAGLWNHIQLWAESIDFRSWRSFLEIGSWVWASFLEWDAEGDEDVALRMTSQRLCLPLIWGKMKYLVQRPNAVGCWEVSFIQLLFNHIQVQVLNSLTTQFISVMAVYMCWFSSQTTMESENF